MGVTVLVSGVPGQFTLRELGEEFDKMFDTDEIGSFKVRETDTPWVRGTRQVALQFNSGYDAMHVQEMLDNHSYHLGGNVFCYLTAKILNRSSNDEGESTELVSSSISNYYDPELPMNDGEVHNESTEQLDAKLKLLKKQKKILKAERKLLKERKKLKQEYKQDLDDSDSQKETHRRKHKKVHEDRDKHLVSTEVTVTAKYSLEYENSKHRGHYSYRHRGEYKGSSYNTAGSSSMPDFRSRSTNKTEYPTNSGYRSRSRSQTSKRHRSKSPKGGSRRQRDQESARRYGSKRAGSPDCNCKKTSNRNNFEENDYRNRHTGADCNRKSSPDNSRIMNLAFEQVRLEFDALYRKKTFDSTKPHPNKRFLMSNVDGIIKNRFAKIQGKTADDLVAAYRTRYSLQEDETLLLKLLSECDELQVMSNCKDSVATTSRGYKRNEKKDETFLQKVTGKCSEREVVNDCKDAVATITSSGYISPVTISPIDKQPVVITEIADPPDTTIKNDTIWTAVDEVLQDVEIDEFEADSTQNIDGHKSLNNYNELTSQKLHNSTDNLFWNPTKIIISEMETLINNLKIDCKHLHSIAYRVVTERLRRVLIGKESSGIYSPVQMYRKQYASSEDETFLKSIIEDVKQGKYGLFIKQLELKEPTSQKSESAIISKSSEGSRRISNEDINMKGIDES